METSPPTAACVQASTALALGFDRPTDELVAAIEDGSLAAVLRTAGDDLGLRAMTDAGDELDDIAVDRQSLMDEYTAVFAPSDDDGPVPYEAHYAPGSLVTNTDILADIAGFYRAFGLDVSDDRRDRVDALATELEYLGFLGLRHRQWAAADDGEAVTVATDATASFLEDHLGRWVGRFVEDTLDGAEHPLYRQLARALEAIVDAECDRVGADPTPYAAVPTAPLASIAGLEGATGREDLTCGATSPMGATTPPDP